MGATTKGLLAVKIEPTAAQGRQLLLAATAVAGTLSLTTQPSAFDDTFQHMFIQVIVSGHTASGTVQIAGKKADGSTAVTETSPTLAAATTDKPIVEYCTSATYNTVNSSGVTITGLTNGTITVYGIYAATRLIPITFDTKVQPDFFSPQDHRGIQYKDFRIQQLIKHVQLDKFESGFYPESDLWWAFGCINSNPSTATIPASPTVLKASAAVSGAPFSLTSQPTTPGMLLQLVVTSTSTFGTVTVTGTNIYGEALTEVVNCYGGAGTFYTQNVFASVGSSGIAVSGLTSGSLAVNGIFGTQWTFNLPSTAFSSLAAAIFTGTESGAYPFTFFEEGTLDMDVQKEIKLSAKVTSQDRVTIGNRATSPMNSSRLPSYGQPYDLPIVGWPATIYIDSLSGTAFTTAYNDLLTFKLSIATAQKATWTATASRLFNRVYTDFPQAMFEATVDFTDIVQFEQFRQNVKQQIAVQFQDPKSWIGTTGGTAYYKTWKFNLPAKYETFDDDRSKEMVQAKVKGVCEYEPSLGYALQCVIINQAPPSYATT